MLDLKNTRDRLRKYKTKLEGDEKRLSTKALMLMKKGDKKNALLLMKVKKKKTTEASNVEAQLLNVYEMVSTIEWETQQIEVLLALTTGKEALAAMHAQMSVDDVLELMDDITDQQDVQDRINDAFSRGDSMASVDDDVLEQELADLEREMAGGEVKSDDLVMPETPTQTPIQMPDAPTNKPVEEKEGEEEEKKVRVAVAA